MTEPNSQPESTQFDELLSKYLQQYEPTLEDAGKLVQQLEHAFQKLLQDPSSWLKEDDEDEPPAVTPEVVAEQNVSWVPDNVETITETSERLDFRDIRPDEIFEPSFEDMKIKARMLNHILRFQDKLGQTIMNRLEEMKQNMTESQRQNLRLDEYLIRAFDLPRNVADLIDFVVTRTPAETALGTIHKLEDAGDVELAASLLSDLYYEYAPTYNQLSDAYTKRVRSYKVRLVQFPWSKYQIRLVLETWAGKSHEFRLDIGNASAILTSIARSLAGIPEPEPRRQMQHDISDTIRSLRQINDHQAASPDGDDSDDVAR